MILEIKSSTRIKDDKRPQRSFWAPGEYLCTCILCGSKFAGDKRAAWCADCAYSRTEIKA